MVNHPPTRRRFVWIFVPGTKFRYSGGGVTIEQQTRDRCDRQAFFRSSCAETVLDKIGMADSTYEQPPPPGRAAMAATATNGDGMPVPGKWHIYPEMAAAGLWTTATDLAKFGIEIALSKQGKANHVLSEATTREMLKPQIEQVGLGFFLGQNKNPEEFGHNGADEGFQAVFDHVCRFWQRWSPSWPTLTMASPSLML